MFQSNTMSTQRSADPLAEAASLLQRSTQLLQQATKSPAGVTAARVRQLPTEQLRRDPALWAAYQRGWADCMATCQRAARAGPPAPPQRVQRNNSQRQTPQPLMSVVVRQPTPPTPLARATSRPNATKSRQRRDQASLQRYKRERKDAPRQRHSSEATTSIPPPPPFSDTPLSSLPIATQQQQTPPASVTTTTDVPAPEDQTPEVPAASGNVSDTEDWESMDVSLTPVAFDDMERLNSTWWTASPTSPPSDSQ